MLGRAPDLSAPARDAEGSPAEPVDEASHDAEEAGGASWVIPVALGVGAGGLFAGIAGTQQYRSAHQEAQDTCPSSYFCTPEEVRRHDELVDDARQARTIAVVGYSVAMLGLVGGAIYYFTRPRKPPETGRLTLNPFVSSQLGGGVLQGTF